MFKLIIPLFIILILCFCSGAAGLKLLGIVAFSFAVGALIFFLFRFITSLLGKKQKFNKNKNVSTEKQPKN